MSNIHLFVKNTIDGRVRFSKEYDDRSFFDLVEKELGGYLPMDWKAIHIEMSEYMGSASKRMQYIAEIPVAVSPTGNILDPEEIIIRDSRRTEKERWYDKLLTVATRLRKEIYGIEVYTEEKIRRLFRVFQQENTEQPDIFSERLPRIRGKKKQGANTQIVPALNLFYGVFLNPTIQRYLILSGAEQKRTSSLHFEGWIPLWKYALSKRQANIYLRSYYPNYRPFEPVKTPVTLKQACTFVNDNHRHHISPRGHKFSVALSDGKKIIGVAIIGRPVSRWKDDGTVLEVTRLAVKEAYPNLCSMLYRTAARIVKEMGYERLVTYTLIEEGGSSLRAAGFELIGESDGGSWNSKKRKRNDRHPIGRKKIWEIQLVNITNAY